MLVEQSVDLSKMMEQNMTQEMMEAMTDKAMYERQLKNSMIVVVTLPIIMVYPMFQKHFVKGVMLGSLKG